MVGRPLWTDWTTFFNGTDDLSQRFPIVDGLDDLGIQRFGMVDGLDDLGIQRFEIVDGLDDLEFSDLRS